LDLFGDKAGLLFLGGVTVLKQIYYGWWIVFAAFAILFVCAGIGFSTLPVFLKFIEHDMSWDRSVISNAGGLSALAAGFSAPLIGFVIDRFGPRAAMIPGAFILSASFAFLGDVGTIPQLYFLYLGVGIGMAATTILPAQTLVTRWFARKRGRAMGIISIAIGLGNVTWPLLSTFLIEEIGWRNAYKILGIVIAVVSVPPIVLLIRSSPAVMGFAVDGDADLDEENEVVGEKGKPAAEDTGFTLREALGTPSLWLIACATFFVTFPSSGFGLHMIAFFTDKGFSKINAASVWSLVMAVSIAGRFFFGWISEQFQKRYFAAAANVVRGFSLLLLILFSFKMLPPAVAVMQLALLYGFANGCNAVMNPLIIGETFGVRSFGKIMGFIGIPFTIGMALGQVAGGWFYVLTHDYNAVFVIFVISFVCAGTAISFAKPLFLFESRSACEAESA
jgi:MFS family permease